MAVPGDECRALPLRHIDVGKLLVGRRIEEGAHAVDLGGVELESAFTDQIPLGFDGLAERFGAFGLHEDLDARLVDVVAATFLVVDAQDGLEITQQVLAWQELADRLADDRRAAESAAHDHFESHVAVRIALHVQTDVMHFRRGAVRR